MFFQEKITESHKVILSDFNIFGYSLYVLREDKIHPFVSGNKFRKLKYNFLEAQENGYDTLLTFGGAFSNHIAAMAAAGKELGLNTIGIIRGEELAYKLLENPTLKFAAECGMKLHFVSRDQYKNKEDLSFLSFLKQKFGDFYCIPEGGTNKWAVMGCSEIINDTHRSFDYICVPVGTGGTIAGIVNASSANSEIIGFSALKGSFQLELVKKYTSKQNFSIIDEYCFGGYAKIDINLIRFINSFYEKTNIPIDPVYTGKMMFGIFDMLRKRKFKENSRILAIHTGGLQGIQGMNDRLIKKGLPQIIT